MYDVRYDATMRRNSLTTAQPQSEPSSQASKQRNQTSARMASSSAPLTVKPFFYIKDSPIYFDEDWKTGIGGALWSTGLALAKYFQSHTSEVRQSMQRIQQKPLSVLELGSGNGFLSVCLMAAAADLIESLVITDTADHLGLIRDTVDRNSHIVKQPDNLTSPKVIITEHEWGKFELDPEVSSGNQAATLLDGGQHFDFIFGSDLSYREQLYDPLILSLKRLCHARTVFLLGVTMKDTLPKFFRCLREAGFHYTRLPDDKMAAEFRGKMFGIFVIQKRKNQTVRLD